MDLEKALPLTKACFICSKNIWIGFFSFIPHPVLVPLTTMNKPLLLCEGFLWNDPAPAWMCYHGAAQWYDLTTTECSLRVRARGRWYFPHNNTICNYFPTSSVTERSVPVEGSEWFVFTFDTQTFTWRWKFAWTAFLVKHRNIQFRGRFGECFITFLKQMSSWSKRRKEGIFNVSPYFILEQINLLILQGEVMARKATQALV